MAHDAAMTSLWQIHVTVIGLNIGHLCKLALILAAAAADTSHNNPNVTRPFADM